MVKIFSLPNCEIIGILNKGEKLRKPLTTGGPIEDSESDENMDQVTKGGTDGTVVLTSTRRTGKGKDFRISRQARKGIWHQQLRGSQTQYSDTLSSNIFREVYDSNKQDHRGHNHDVGLLQHAPADGV